MNANEIKKILYYIAVIWVVISAFSVVYTVLATVKNFFKTMFIWLSNPFTSVGNTVRNG